jgi:dihydroxy-acid dehydratase
MPSPCSCPQTCPPPRWQQESHPDFDTVFSMLRQDGLLETDRDRPVIGVCNTWNEVVPGHLHLRDLAEQAKLGIRAGGGVGLEFGCVAPCDGFGNANAGYRYILPMRDNIADAVELMAQAHHFDGLVLLSSCDKSNPGVMMGMARLDRPAVFLGGGMGHQMCPGEGLGTAMSMQCLAEALGIALPGTATTYANGAPHLHLSLQAGQQVVELVRRGIRPGHILTRGAFENAIRVNMAIGGSYNTFIHLPAIAYQLGIRLTAADFDRLSDTTPYLCSLSPNGPCVLSQLGQAGGILAVMKVLEPLLDLEAMTVTGRTVGGNLESVRVDFDMLPHPDVLRPLDHPLRPTGGLCVLTGNLAPAGAVIRSAGVLGSMLQFEGPARVFDSEHDAMAAVARRDYRPGEVLVIRNEGIVGGPGMPEQSCVGWTLDRQGMYDKVYLVTDGRYSGACHGPLVGLVTPEAALGGPIAVVRTGDTIRIDVTGKRLDVLLADEEIRRRLTAWRPPAPRVSRGYLARYARAVVPALDGGYLPDESGAPSR